MTGSFLSSSWHRVSDLRPRLRGHAQVHRHRYRGESWYVVQDDLSGRFHRFTPAVYLFIGMMDGRRTVAELWKEVVTRLGDDAPTQDQIIQILSQLHSADILQCDLPPDAMELLERSASHTRKSLLQRYANPMSLRFRLWDPDRFLTRTAPLMKPLFGWTGAIVWCLVVGFAAVLAGLHWSDLTQDITDRVLATENLIAMALVFPILKAIHELGHGYAAKVYGGAVHEFGVMLLVMAPVPYVDATSSAAFRSKWQRAIVASGGMIAELFVAALAMIVWVLVEPGGVRAIAYDVMLIAGVSTVIFNANPLLRFDGYYIFCDLIEIPNLGNRSNRYWAWLVERYLFGVRSDPPHATPGEKVWFILYAPLAFAYRMIVMFGIALFVAGEFFLFGVLLAIWAVAMGLGLPIAKSLSHVLVSPKLREKRGRAVGLTFGGIAAVAALLLLAPTPLHTHAEGVVWLPEDSFVRASTDAFVSKLLAQPGAQVSPGTPLVESVEPGIVAEAAVLKAQMNATAVRLESEEFTDRVQADITRRELEIRQANFQRATERADQLVIRAAASGAFVVPRAIDLPGRFIKRGEVVGYITAPQTTILRVVVPQADIELVRARRGSVAVKFAERPAETFAARLIREVPGGSDRLPSKALTEAGGGVIATDPRDQQQTKTLQRTFQFDVAVERAPTDQFGGRVHVRFAHGTEPLGFQIYRRLRQLMLSRFNA